MLFGAILYALLTRTLLEFDLGAAVWNLIVGVKNFSEMFFL